MRRPRPDSHPFLWAFALGLLHALLFALAFPPVGAWPLAFVAVAPLCIVAMRTPRPARSALAVSLAASPMWLFEQRWLIDVTAAGYPALCALLSVYPGLFVWLGARLRRTRPFDRHPLAHGLALGALWAGIEFFRGAVFMHGYPWYLAGHPTIDFPLWAAPAAVIGAYGVSLLTAQANALVALAVVRPAAIRRVAVAAAALVAVVALLDLAARRPAPATDGSPARPVRVAVIQTNVPQSNKTYWSFPQRLADFTRFLELSRAALADPRPDLIIWPETMFPGIALNPDAVGAERAAGLVQRADGAAHRSTLFYDGLLADQQKLGVPMLVGAIARDGMRIVTDKDGYPDIEQDAMYNSAFVVAGGRVLDERYDKIHLTPFGEEMPYISQSKWLESKLLDFGARGMRFDLTAGAKPLALDVPLDGGARTLRVATPICFEATMPDVCRRLLADGGRRRADVVISLTNDGWFGRWRGPREQHLQLARWRAVELGTAVVRAANTGISCLVDPAGKVIRRGPDGRDTAVDVEGVMSISLDGSWIAPGRPLTPYARAGDAVGWGALAVSLALAFWALIPASRRRDAAMSCQGE